MGQDLSAIPVPDAGGKASRKSPLPPLPVLADSAALASVVSRQLLSSRRNSTQLALLIVQSEADIAPALFEAMGERLRGRVRATDMVFKMAAWGFAVLLLGAARPHVPGVQRRLERALDGAYVLDGVDGLDPVLRQPSVRIGMAAHPQADVAGADLVRAAMPSANV